MKRLLALLLALCLPLSALAETIAERVGAPESWQGEFQSNTGKTHVYVDMTIEVPEAESIPLWSVKQHIFTMEEATHAADVLLGEGAWRQVAGSTALEDGPRYLESEWSSGEGIGYECDLEVGTPGMDDRRYVSVSYDLLKAMPDWYEYVNMDYGTYKHHYERNIGTEEEAIALADALIEQIAPGMFLESVDPEKDGRYMSHRSGRGNRADYGYRLYYARLVDGIRVTPVYQQGAEAAREQLNPVLPYESLYVDVGADGIFEMDWRYPIEITGKLSEDCELLPFEQIMDIFGLIAPMTIQPYEYEANNNLYINRAVLGYMCVQERNNPHAYRLVPVWDFFGARTIGRERYDTHNWSYLTINAIDGTVIDRDLGY